MSTPITIDDQRVDAGPRSTILQAASEADIYIPSLCAHPSLPPQRETPAADAIFHGSKRICHDPEGGSAVEGESGCGLCVVHVDGTGDVPACATLVQPGMQVRSEGAELELLRRQRLAAILARHPHVCLTCAQREGCTREPCSMNVPVEERCCELLGRCELQAVAEYVGIDPATARYVPRKRERIASEPLFDRDPELCIACGRCVRACNGREVRALGWVRDGESRRWVGPIAPTLVQAGCRLCGSCVEVCPTGALLDRGVRAAERAEALVPCRSACPARTDVPRYVRLVAAGRFHEAAAVVAERAPLVEVLGQICFHPCEDVCRRHDVNGAPISICRIKREAGAASATDWTAQLPHPRPDSGHRVAVVGAGPAGLVAAHTLRLLGHRVTLLEARSTLGGMLAHAIPAFRLSRDVVARETAALVRDLSVRTGVRVGSNGLSVADLRAEHDAVVIATGASRSVRLNVPGEEGAGICDGLAFLGDLAHGELAPGSFGDRSVLVVGGGNVAIDCARGALRLGAARVAMVCLEQPDEMPAYAEEVDRATAEGVRIWHGWGIHAFSGNGALQRVTLKRCTRVFDAHGRFDPAYDEEQTDEVTANAILLAVGQRADRSILPDNCDGVFQAGDLATGAGSVVEAIASGRDAALSVDRFLGGRGDLDLRLGPAYAPVALGRVESFATLPRSEPQPLQCLEVDALPPGLGPEIARREADRCLRCDLRLAYKAPARPPSRTTRLPVTQASLERVPQSEGVLRFYDADGEIVEIVGGPDMRREVQERLGAERGACFDFEPCPMYTQRQNELLSQYMEAHGRMPPGVSGEEDLDDLF
ncbi:MAG: FAD-dependent oxidoreductase [Candidatus Latescibacterota bacterium]|nr:MAG: FAD-dependent oxidoreductase [Candidatus Latescibacterota bacterium]